MIQCKCPKLNCRAKFYVSRKLMNMKTTCPICYNDIDPNTIKVGVNK